jgi:hypothetical protein
MQFIMPVPRVHKNNAHTSTKSLQITLLTFCATEKKIKTGKMPQRNQTAMCEKGGDDYIV